MSIGSSKKVVDELEIEVLAKAVHEPVPVRIAAWTLTAVDWMKVAHLRYSCIDLLPLPRGLFMPNAFASLSFESAAKEPYFYV